MDLLERYLGAIARQLPDAQKADVTAELRDVLLSQVEEAESRLDRPLRDEEIEALLIRFGHPLTVAGRYRKVQHLIGPEVFPFWWAGLKAALVIVIAIYVVLIVLETLAGRPNADIDVSGAPSFEAALIFVFGAVTLVCALIERFGKAALLTRWKPRNLPPAGGRSRSQFDIVVEIGVGVVFLLWWTGAIPIRNTIPQSGLSIDLAPVWRAWFWPILAYGVYAMVADVVALLRPGRALLVEGLQLIRNLAAAAIFTAVYSAGHWLQASSSVLTPDALATVQAHLDRGMKVGIVATIGVFLALAALSLWRLRQAARVAAPPLGANRPS